VSSNIREFAQRIPPSVKWAIFVVLAAKILLLAIGYAVTIFVVGYHSQPWNIVAYSFAKWDGPNFVRLAKGWYVNTGDAANLIVYFPLYPFLIRIFTINFNYADLTAMAISNVFSGIAFSYLYKLAKLEFNEKVAFRAVLFLSIFPTAYFLTAPYTESLFFAFVLSSLYYSRIGKWQLAGITSFFASLTRLPGLLMFPVLVTEYLNSKGWSPRKISKNIVWAFSSIGGFLIYLNINNQVTGNPFTFVTVQANHFFERFSPKDGLMAAYYFGTTSAYPNNITLGIAPLGFAVFGLIVIALAVWKRFRPVYIVYTFLSWAFAVSVSFWISVPRYIMAMLPMFMLFGLLSNRKLITIVSSLVSLSLLCFFTILFVRGWWAF